MSVSVVLEEESRTVVDDSTSVQVSVEVEGYALIAIGPLAAVEGETTETGWLVEGVKVADTASLLENC
jgi:hypothetical protein